MLDEEAVGELNKAISEYVWAREVVASAQTLRQFADEVEQSFNLTTDAADRSQAMVITGLARAKAQRLLASLEDGS